MATEKVIPMTPPDDRHVHAGGDGKVDKDPVHVSKKAGHQVTWFSRGKASIEFSSSDGSPFEKTTFQVPAGGSVSSGPAKPTATAEKAYKYSVVGENGTEDPTVIIHN
jgi:hypothetical protein